MKKKFYKNNVGCIIFTVLVRSRGLGDVYKRQVLVYPINVMESCVTYEKIMNECRMFYE